MRFLLSVLGSLAILMGALWVGQGLGLIHWPASSFMVDQRIWAVWGILLAAAGVLLNWWARRR
ncbi:hypothetical protein FPZ24_06750 [Sphingomonas panacisoli]|uniref:Uncharacterized protein n=1 Tax=Sphingomonas panacisoli TaxID=1813879 RepID=A0A5B8LHW9_9SPHN|nr:hypothetical protein [Sphingomonas panacisoli]QDZ07214.1 hypothetical protein FPZ24_06750 [Sphingomonas panacisoli]